MGITPTDNKTKKAQTVRLAASRTAEGRTRVVMLSSAPTIALGPGLAPTLEQKRPAIGRDHAGPLEATDATSGVSAGAGSASSDGKCRSWIMLLPQGQYDEPRYGKLNITPQLLAQLKATFDARVRQIDIALDEDHDAGKATGWLEAVEVRPAGMTADGCAAPAGLWGLVRWTALGEADLRGELYRYFSIEYGPYKDIASGKKYPNVIWGGGLTNRPVMKRMPAVALSEGSKGAVSRKPWSAVNKASLPRSCFLIQGDPNDKSTWKLPIYEGAGPKDAAGHYTKRGALNLNAVRAAIAAIGGARTGAPMAGVPSGLKARLERLLARYGNGKSTTQAAGARSAGDKQHSKGSRTVSKTKQQQVEELDEAYELGDEGEEEADTFAFDDGSGDMADETYDEQDGGPDGDEGEDGDDFDASSDTHGAMTTDGHAHGKYAEHSHDGDADHSEAEMKRGRKKASESGRERQAARHSHAPAAAGAVRALREQLEAQNRELAEMRFALYEKEVKETLDGWRAQTFQFKEGKTREGKPVMRSGRVAISKAFADAYKGFMLKEGIRLPSATRAKLNEIIEMGLSTAVVDLSARGSAFDQESRRTLKSGERGGMASESDAIEETAQRLLSEMGKSLKELDPAAQLALYERAEKDVRASR